MARIRGMYNVGTGSSAHEGSTQKPMSLNDLQGAFVILGLGLFTASVAWIVERARFKRKYV
jgi:hypothetical protein